MQTLVKICGITNVDDARGSAQAGADFLGYIFYAPSKRFVAPRVAKEIIGSIRKEFPNVQHVGVFVDERPENIAWTRNLAGLDLVQLHGEESPEVCRELESLGIDIIKTIGISPAGSHLDFAAYHVPYYLCDTFDDKVKGGTGRAFDLRDLPDALPISRMFYAGGLSPENIADRIRIVKPYAVDVSSGVESGPGRKNLQLVEKFIKNVKTVENVKSGRTERVSANLSMVPDEHGKFGDFGGRYVPETLMSVLIELEREYDKARNDPDFQNEFTGFLHTYVGRPTPLFHAERLSSQLSKGRVRIYLKREDLCHTGAHKINNSLGQALLAKRMGKRKIIAETGAGQHGVATATACAMLGLECEVFMGGEDMERQSLNVFRMRLLGARVTRVTSGTATLKDATNEAMRQWMSRCDDTHYIVGSVVGPHPFPMLVRDFQSVIGNEARKQILEIEGRLPDTLVACVGGGSNSIGLFHAFYNDVDVKMYGVEAAGRGMDSGEHAASINRGSVGVFHGSKIYLLQTEDGQITPAHSISAGLDYPGSGPEHSFYYSSGRASYVGITDDEALEGVKLLCKTEGIIPALESAHAIAYLSKLVPEMKSGVVVVCLSGRGDKDVFSIAKGLGEDI